MRKYLQNPVLGFRRASIRSLRFEGLFQQNAYVSIAWEKPYQEFQGFLVDVVQAIKTDCKLFDHREGESDQTLAALYWLQTSRYPIWSAIHIATKIFALGQSEDNSRSNRGLN